VLPDLARVLELEQNLQALYNASCSDLGQLLECGAEERPLMREYSSAEVTSCVMTARRLLAFCCESGWVATLGAIIPVAAIGCRSATELLATVAAEGMRSLPPLHLAVMSKKPAMVRCCPPRPCTAALVIAHSEALRCVAAHWLEGRHRNAPHWRETPQTLHGPVGGPDACVLLWRLSGPPRHTMRPCCCSWRSCWTGAAATA
jgi:hypothetical protein